MLLPTLSHDATEADELACPNIDGTYFGATFNEIVLRWVRRFADQ
jgi:hypothetical protein